MKKYIYISGCVLALSLAVFFIYGFIDILTFTPLKDKEFKKLFFSYGEINKKYSADYIGLSGHGELLEIYLFNTKKIQLGINYPNYSSEWENEKIKNETITSKWINCPLDTATYRLFKFALKSNDYNQNKCLKSFNMDLCNPDNFYSYVYFNDLEHYLLLYCPQKEELYYVRVRL